VPRWLQYVIVICIYAAAVAFVVIYSPEIAPRGEPLLSGAPEFIILSLVAALALYLRQVNLDTLDLRYKIQHDELWNRPPEREYRNEKLERLRETSDAIMLASPFMFVVIIAVCIRIVWDGYDRFYFKWPQVSARLYKFDILIRDLAWRHIRRSHHRAFHSSLS
jgi:hypothetical protein